MDYDSKDHRMVRSGIGKPVMHISSLPKNLVGDNWSFKGVAKRVDISTLMAMQRKLFVINEKIVC